MKRNLLKLVLLTWGACLCAPLCGQDKSDEAATDAVSSRKADDVQAEIGENESFDSVPKDESGHENSVSSELNAKKLLGEDTPEWVKKGLVLGDEHRLAISSSLLPDVEQCREDLKSRMMIEVRSYLDKHVLEKSSAYQLAELTQEYVEKYWVNPAQTFDNVQDRPSGTYHQLWIGLHISADQLKKVREWEMNSFREKRLKQVGIIGGAGIATITLLSGLVGVLARREKAKLKS
jgi:hypothetical protein